MLPEKLHARIRHQLALPEPDLEARTLAIELAEVGRRARERLEQCATLVRLGNEQAALQAAEAEPSLPELCAWVNFAGSAEWTRLCQKHSLPAPPTLDDAQIVAVELLYGKPIDENHPLYRDYRQAIRERDDGRALSVLRSITAVNPGDGNAQTELKRVRSKFMRESLAKVTALFAAERPEDAVQLMDRMEQLGIAAILDEPAWQSAIDRRAAWAQGLARRRISAHVSRATEARAAQDWRSCADAVGAARTVERQSGIQAAPSEAGELADCESWAGEHVNAAAAEHRERTEADNLRSEWSRLEQEAARRASAELLRRLNRWLERAEAAAGRLEPELLEAARQTARILHRRVVRGHTVRTAAGVAALLAVVTAAHFTYQISAERSALGAALGTAERPLEAGDFDAAERAIADSESLATTPALRAEYQAGSEQLRKRIQAGRAAEQSLAAESAFLADALARGIDAANFAQVERRARALTEALGKASPAVAARVRARSGDLARIIAACEGVSQGLRSQIETLSESLEAAVGSGERLADAAQAEATSRRIRDILETPGARAVVGNDAADQALALAERVTQRVELERAREGALRKLDQSADLRAYLAAAAELAREAPEGPEKRAAQAVTDATEALGGLPRNLLGPRTAAMWDAAATPEPQSFVPNAEEQAVVARLGDDATLRNLRKYIIREHVSPEPGVSVTRVREPEFLVGKPTAETRRLGEGTETLFSGKALRSSGDIQDRQWSLRRFSNGVSSGFEPVEGLPLPEVEYHARFTRFFSQSGGRLAESPLRTLERVRREAGSPLLRAYHLQELYQLASIRPAESGLAFSPSALRDAVELRGITQNSLRPTEFAFCTDTALKTEISRFLARTPPAYVEEARYLRALVEGLRRGGIVLAGRTGIDGRPVWRSQPATGSVLAGLDAEGRPAALFEVGPDGAVTTLANPAPLTPLVRLATSPAEAADAAGARPNDTKPPAGNWNNLLRGKDL